MGIIRLTNPMILLMDFKFVWRINIRLTFVKRMRLTNKRTFDDFEIIWWMINSFDDTFIHSFDDVEFVRRIWNSFDESFNSFDDFCQIVSRILNRLTNVRKSNEFVWQVDYPIKRFLACRTNSFDECESVWRMIVRLIIPFWRIWDSFDESAKSVWPSVIRSMDISFDGFEIVWRSCYVERIRLTINRSVWLFRLTIKSNERFVWH